MVSEGLLRRLSRFQRALSRLHQLRDSSKEELLSNEDKLDVLENNWRVAVEALLDIGRYIISREGWEPPSSYRDVATILHRHSVISAEQRLLLQGLAGLRNVLVHLYSDVDYGRLIDSLSLLGRVEDLARAMLKYLEERGLDP